MLKSKITCLLIELLLILTVTQGLFNFATSGDHEIPPLITFDSETFLDSLLDSRPQDYLMDFKPDIVNYGNKLSNPLTKPIQKNPSNPGSMPEMSEPFSVLTSYTESSPFIEPEPQLRVAFDISHSPSWEHDDAFLLDIYLDTVNVELYYLGDIFELSEDIDVLLIPPSTAEYSTDELLHIDGWFASEGTKVLWVAGDSDYGGWYNPDQNNAILDQVDSLLRISADSVNDYVFNDGAPYRVAGQPVSGGELNSVFTDGVYNAIFHGPTSVLGFQGGSIVDLTENSIPDVEIVISTGFDSEAINYTGPVTEFDYYSQNKPFGEAYPLMAVDYHYGGDKYVIASGEAVFTSYRNMYDMHTYQGLRGNRDTYTGGLHNGKILVDNVLNFLGLDPMLPRIYGHAPIYIYSDDEFLDNGFVGSGTIEDPYRLEGYLFASYVEDLITIHGTSAHFEIANNHFYGLFSGWTAINLMEVAHGTLIGNDIHHFHNGILLWNSYENTIMYNFLESNINGLALENRARDNYVMHNGFFNNENGVYIYNNPFNTVDFRPFFNITAFDSDYLHWQVSIIDPDEFIAQDWYENLVVELFIDGDPVDVSFSDIYIDEERWIGQYRFDIDYWSDPLPVGEYNFTVYLLKEGEYENVFTSWAIVEPTPSLGNIIIENDFFNNYNGFQLWLASDNIIEGNYLEHNYGEGIGIYGSHNNVILGNYVGYSGRKGIMVSYDFGLGVSSEFNTIAFNSIYSSAEDGISLEWADNNFVVGNDIFENAWAGIRLFGTSSYNTLEDNTIHNNWGCGIAFESYSEVHMRFWQDITATEADHIFWQASLKDPDETEVQFWYENLEVLLTVDGEPVGVWFSELYFDGERWCFDMDYFSNPLPVGVHEFHVQFILAGELDSEFMALVTVIPATDENYITHNDISENDIFENGWTGIILGRSHYNTITDNQIYNNWGPGIDIGFSSSNIIEINNIYWNEFGINLNSANHNLIANNDIFENNWNGIHLSGTSSENSLVGNNIHYNWWGAGIQLETWNEVYLRFGQDIIATEADYISWIDSFRDPDGETVQFWYENLEVFLTVDGEPVGVWFSEMYFDGEQWAFEMGYFSEPLPAGVYEFTIQFILAGEFLGEDTSIVTVVPATDENYTSHNYISENDIFENGWSGIILGRSHTNTITNNQIHNNWGSAIDIGSSSNNLVEFNTIYWNNEGIILNSANHNHIAYNDIFENNWNGIQLSGTSSENTVVGNIIHRNWWGAGISLDSFNMIIIIFGQDITATEADYISWHDSFRDPDQGIVQFWYDNLEVLLTVDGEPVGVWFSEMYFDGEQWAFDMGYDSNPLPAGVYEFTIQFILAGEFLSEVTLHVTVVPATDENYVSHNTISGNDISENGWNGINLWRARSNHIIQNQIINNFGIGIEVTGSYNVISANNILENDFEGIRLSGDYSQGFYPEHNAIEFNIICRNGQTGINLDSVNYNIIANNDISEHPEYGIQLGGPSSNNIIEKNAIYNNQNGGINVDGSTVAHMRYWQNITVTEADSISWQLSWLFEDEGEAWYYHDNIETTLTVDGQEVQVWYSGVYEGEFWHSGVLYQWRFDVDYYSEPLPVGIHEFTVMQVLDETIVEDWTAYVTVEPATDENYSTHNTISGNNISGNGWDGGIRLYRTHKNYLAHNTIVDNGWGGITMESSHKNIIQSNEISNNVAQGIWIGYSEFNSITNNIVLYNGFDSGINLHHSYGHYIAYNTVSSNGHGILLEYSNNNIIMKNEISFNFDTGILLVDSGHNSIFQNKIFDNSNGIVLASSPPMVVEIRWGDVVTVTDVDSIAWQLSIADPSLPLVQDWYNNIEVFLTVDDVPIEVSYSDIYYDYGWGMYRFDMDYFSDPLPVGVHEFYTEVYYKDEFYANTAIVTVIPYSGTVENEVSNNLIYDNWNNGITLVNSDRNMIFGNELFNYFIDMILINSKNNIISRNFIYSTSVAGIVLVDNSQENSVSFNIIFGCFYNIYLGFSSFNVILFNGIDNSEYGIFLYNSNENLLIWNRVSLNIEGIYLFESHGNLIFRNLIAFNHIGIHLVSSIDNTLSYNMFFDNEKDILEEP